MARLTITNIGKLYTLAGMRAASGRAASTITPLTNATLVIEDGVVARVEGTPELDPQPRPRGNPYRAAPVTTEAGPGAVTIDAMGALVTPGLVDPHTHAVYGGNRAHEMALKQAGVPYLDILVAGGGIHSTVAATRAASDEELFDTAAVRLRSMLSMGTTTVEVKSGYGLSIEQELRLLRIIRDLGRKLPMTIVPTFMGAHAVPAEFRDNPDGYVDEVVETMIPAVAQEGLAEFCDVFCEPGVLSVEQSRRILDAGREHGLKPKIHADEIAIEGTGAGGAGLAAEVRAISADHLRETGDEGLGRLAEAGVIPVVLPATSFFLGDSRYANARRMIDEFDLPVALATDCNPGTSPTESIQLVMALAASRLKMTPEEILAACTINASRAVGRATTVGSLEPGKTGDGVVWQAHDLDMLSYRFGGNQAAMVIKAGRVV